MDELISQKLNFYIIREFIIKECNIDMLNAKSVKVYNILEGLSKLNHDIKYIAEHLKTNYSKTYAKYKK